MRKSENSLRTAIKSSTILLAPDIAHGKFYGAIRQDDEKNAEDTKLNQQKTKQIQSERGEVSSFIARKVIHEVNNPLAIIKNYLKILGLKLPEEHPALADLIIINEEIERVTRIVHQLSGFSEPVARRIEIFDINNLITDLIKITKKSVLTPYNIEVHLNLDFSLPYISTEKDSLRQVFINLIKNSVEAMPSGGNIYIETGYIHDPEEIMGDHGKHSKGIDISFRDDGPGLGNDIKQHLFEPYNSSKGDGHSGLGLSIVHNIIKQLKGTITCPDHIEKGSLFMIRLPVTMQS